MKAQSMKLTHLLSLAFITLALSACATPMSVSMEKKENFKVASNPHKAQIFFYRDKAFVGSLRGLYVTIDGERVGGLNSGTYFVSEVSPGTHTFSVEDWLGDDPSRKLTVKAGEKRYLKGSIQMGAWDAQPKLEIMNAEEGSAAIESLTYATLKTQKEKPAKSANE